MTFELGNYLHTFTILGRCYSTGQLGIGIATYSLAVGAYCPVVRPNIGVVSSRAYADPHLGILSMRLLELGFKPDKILKEMQDQDPYFSYGQIGIIDRDGKSACHTGPDTRPWAGHLIGDGYVAMGNVLAGQHF